MRATGAAKSFWWDRAVRQRLNPFAESWQLLGDPFAESVGGIACAVERGEEPLASVGVENRGVERQPIGGIASPRAQGDKASPFELEQGATLGLDCTVGAGIVERCQQRASFVVIASALDSEGTLPDRRQEPRGTKPFGHVVIEAEPP